MQTPFVETDCTVTLGGHTFESGGAVVTEDRAVAYLESGIVKNSGNLTDWRGNVIGRYNLNTKWPTPNSWVSSWMYSIVAVINGRTYYGRTQGAGMVTFLKAYKNQGRRLFVP